MKRTEATKDNDGANEPTIIAQCPECDALIACAVAPLDCEATRREALSNAADWVADGFKVSTVKVRDIRTWEGKMFGHSENCARGRRARSESDADVQEPMPLLSGL